MTCIVCKQPCDKFDKAFQAAFCGGAYCTEQMEMAWGAVDNARDFYRMLYVNPDGTPRETPLNWFPSPKPLESAYHVDAAKYKK